MTNALPGYMTVDVEEYFQVAAFAGTLDKGQWDQLPSRLDWCMERVLACFDDAGIKATFFVVGSQVKRRPEDAVRNINQPIGQGVEL